MTYPRSRLLGVNLPRQTPELQLLDATLRMWVAGKDQLTPNGSPGSAEGGGILASTTHSFCQESNHAHSH